jgi:hypothetical protein
VAERPRAILEECCLSHIPRPAALQAPSRPADAGQRPSTGRVQASYRSPGEKPPRRKGHSSGRRGHSWRAVLRRRGEQSRSRHDGDLAPHRIQKKLDASRAVDSLKFADHLSERSGQDFHLLARLQTFVKVNEPGEIGECHQPLDDPGRDQRWKFAYHQQAHHAERAVHRAPAMALQIERNEEVVGKQRRPYHAKLSGMADALQEQRQKRAKALRVQLRGGADLAT